MPRIGLTGITVLAYIGIFCSIPMLRAQFLRHDFHILFWVLVLEHFVMIPLSIRAFMSFLKNWHALLSFCLGAVATAGLLFFIWAHTIKGVSDSGMGIIIFLIFPFVEALVAIAGAICGVVWIIKKARGTT